MKESDLILQAQAGDSAALGELYEQYVEQIYRFHFWQTNGSKQTAEDLTQDTFFEAARSLPKFRRRSSFKNWLYIIAKRQLAKWLRQKYSLPELPLFETLADTPDWIDPKQQRQKTRQLEYILGQLSEREAAVLRCRYLQNLSVDETAAQLGLTASNVKVIRHRSIKKLKTMLERNQLDTITSYEYVESEV